MMSNTNFFTEVAYRQTHKFGNEICGDVILSKKIPSENRTILVLSDGLGSGIKANVLASMTASMIMNFTSLNEPVERTADIIIQTLPVDPKRKIGFASFSVADINNNGQIRLLEYGNPKALIYRSGKIHKPERTKVDLGIQANVHQALYETQFEAQQEDRLILFSDGLNQSGIGRKDMPFGWDRNEIESFVEFKLNEVPELSAEETSSSLLSRALHNDIYKAQDDISCACMYFRNPRKLLICTGPPFKMENDGLLAEKVMAYPGKRVVCGGTTASILSRELQAEIDVDLNSGKAGLPPVGTMKHIDLVTEGILTIGRLDVLLENYVPNERFEKSPAGMILEHILKHDEIEFLVGTKVNEAHQDPSLPVELEIRRNVVKRISKNLEDKLLKKVKITYL